jgi:uncharacterized protein (DUF1919 family)
MIGWIIGAAVLAVLFALLGFTYHSPWICCYCKSTFLHFFNNIHYCSDRQPFLRTSQISF